MRNGAENMKVQDAMKEDRTLADILDNVLGLSQHVNAQSSTIDEYLLKQDFDEDMQDYEKPFTVRQKLLEIEETLKEATGTLERIRNEVDPRGLT